MIIRSENKNDYSTIYELVKTAFETAKVKDGDEQDFVNRLRSSEKFIPELALVAEEDNKIIGHIMFTKTWVENETGRFEALLLAPLSVLLEHRSQGVGSCLVNTGFQIARDMGYKAVFLAGDPAYYHRFGFSATISYGIKACMDIPEELNENIMVCELVPGALARVTGLVDLI